MKQVAFLRELEGFAVAAMHISEALDRSGARESSQALTKLAVGVTLVLRAFELASKNPAVALILHASLAAAGKELLDLGVEWKADIVAADIVAKATGKVAASR